VQNCDIGLGVRFWLIIPTGAVLMGQSVAWAASVLPRGRLPVALAVVAAEIGALLYRLVWQPPITGHQWFIGYFPGSIYNEALSLPSSLLWYRAENVCLALCVVLAVEVAWRRRVGRPVGQLLLGLAAIAVLGVGLRGSSFEHGVRVTRADSIRVLGGHLQTEHFDIYYDPSDIPPRRLPLLAEDHEHSYAHHKKALGVDVVAWRDGRRIRSFVYPSSSAQQQLLGSRGTMIARPWTHELHIRWDEHAEGALSHELVHIFSAAFGAGPLQLATQGGLFPSIGVLEGLAEATEQTVSELDLHSASAALRRLDRAPDLRDLFDPAGFWSQPPRKAYTLMGSFMQYLIARHGIEQLKAAYGRGDFQAAYGRSVEDLITEWEGFIDEHPLSEEDVELAGYLYRRGSIFQRVCARTMGELKRQAYTASARGEDARARALWEEIAGLEPDNPDHRLSLADVQADGGDHAAASETLAELLEGRLSAARRARALELQGDIAWRGGAHTVAADAYSAAMEAALPASSRRRLFVKRHGVTEPEGPREAAQRYMLGERGRADTLYTAQRWAELSREDPVPAYLVGRMLYQLESFEEAERWLSSAVHLPDPDLREERGLTLARARYLTGDLDGADQSFSALLQVSSDRIRGAAEDGRARIAWKRDSGQ
jgi:tetratricopeptide (TPR) repeat protein